MTLPDGLQIAFDADDTLWHNESMFARIQERLRTLLVAYAPPDEIQARLNQTERRNLSLFGYGIKGFTLSMIETALELSAGRLETRHIQEIMEWGKWMLAHPVELLTGAGEVIEQLAKRYKLMLITKGDLFDQEGKLARSGLARHFPVVEIVSEKDEETYSRLLQQYSVPPHRFVMVGNSLRSDILPVVALGGNGVHVPYHTSWVLDHADLPSPPPPRLWSIDSLLDLPALLDKIDACPPEP